MENLCYFLISYRFFPGKSHQRDQHNEEAGSCKCVENLRGIRDKALYLPRDRALGRRGVDQAHQGMKLSIDNYIFWYYRRRTSLVTKTSQSS